ncbi:MAG: hypothetical protein HC836_49645 [Richelia sp. RM2_1_2]|nr:hypothetical protein [Richelia sp. RM2_1_2]
MITIDKTKLNEYIDAGLIIANEHPVLPIKILNYSRKAQFEKIWNEYTLICRGLVIDDDYNIVARAFPKFFNYEEHKPEDIPNERYEIYDKMDGSLGILFHYDNQWHIATRGSFVSDQHFVQKKF